MRVLRALTLFAALSVSVCAQDLRRGNSVQEMESESARVKSNLARAVANEPANAAALTAYAEFLDRYGDPRAAVFYGRLLAVLREQGDTARATAVERRLARLQLLNGDPATSAGAPASGSADRTAPPRAQPRPAEQPSVAIPGPLRSFARMTAISPDVPPEQVLTVLARNVVMNGYQAASGDSLEQTEYLKLVHRYIAQARELEALAGEQKVIRVPACDTVEAANLLRILGYRLRGSCGSDVAIETVNSSRAFVTADSGFPLQDLEQALRSDHLFEYPYGPTTIPVIFGPEYWQQGQKQQGEFIETFLATPSVCRLYLGMAKLDPETREAFRRGIPAVRLKAFAHVLDFYGGAFEIRNGEAVVPGGAASAAGWAALAGIAPSQGAAFFEKLLSKDDGWLASLYDSLARLQGASAAYFGDPGHMKRFYAAVRGRATSPGPARPVFRANTDMMMLTSRLRIEANGAPHIPGGIAVWKAMFAKRKQTKYDGRLSKPPGSWTDTDDVVEALFTLTRAYSATAPLKIFLAANEIDRARSTPLSAAMVERLARDYDRFASQYQVFNEAPGLSESAMSHFLDAADSISKVRDQFLRADSAGAFQALTSLWQILVRQGSIRPGEAGTALDGISARFTGIRGYPELFDSSRDAVKGLVARVGRAGEPQPGQTLLDILAGPEQYAGSSVWEQARIDLERIMDAQRVTPVDTLFEFAGMAERLARGERPDAAALNRLAGIISEVELPKPDLSSTERLASGAAYWLDRRIDSQRKLNLSAALAKAGGDPEKLAEIKGSLAPLLRDTLVAMNYAYYSPPGAQLLYTNPLFVRSHDFLGQNGNDTWRATDVSQAGWPSSGGGRLTGSLSALPYALAMAEQNFLVPSREQALIWTDFVPQMLVSAKAPRWWNVTPAQLHWVGLHLRYGRELLAEAALDEAARSQALDALGDLAPPGRVGEVRGFLERREVAQAERDITPAELFWLARTLAPSRHDDSCVLAELRSLAASRPDELNYGSISRAFGSPKLTLTNSYRPELLNLRTFPALMGYSSRIMAESWESNTLYWAALADELQLSPAELNSRIPEWTRKFIENIFASNLEDWQAVLRSLLSVGESERAQSANAAAERRAALDD